MARYFFIPPNRRRLNIPRILRDRNTPLDYMTEAELLRNYRLDRDTILDLCGELQDRLQRPTHRSQALPVSLQVLIALRYYATGSFQSVLADGHGERLNSVSRSIHTVSSELSRTMNAKIQFPETREQINKIKQGFYGMYGFPNVIGAVDGTLIPVKAPTEDEHLFITRKGYHAINVQGICDSNCVFLNLVVRWPGSTHDAFVWNNCEVARLLEEEDLGTSWLLGDSAYPLKPNLLTPVLNPNTPAEMRYNSAHKRTRSVVERSYGLWKMRFRCLHKSGGYLMYSPAKNVNIICATGVLHNICIRKRLPLPEDDDDDSDDDDDEQCDGNDGNNVDNNNGRRVRDQLIENTFSV